MKAWFGLFGSTEMPETNRVGVPSFRSKRRYLTVDGLAALALVET